MAFFGRTNIVEQLCSRYNVSGKVVERLLSFYDLSQGNAENISANVISSFKRIFHVSHNKQTLVA